ncbi:MAG: peroxide stress protein YaaA [Magnetococcales bacterium]|nr:peroxide stress protein YaaA [Magnetococcales bacterium]
MIITLSPAKKLDTSKPDPAIAHSLPRQSEQTQALLTILKGISANDLAKLMKISEALSNLNYERFQNVSMPFNLENAKQSVLMFQGDTYVGLNAGTMTPEQLNQAQKRLRILSGFYGLLRPLDLMQPYRLEMGTRLQNPQGKNLYAFWGDTITDLINADLAQQQSPVLINLASIEYFKSVQVKRLKGDLITPVFKEIRNGVPKVIGLLAKRARGMMARYILDQDLQSPEGLRDFSQDGYLYQPDLSDTQNWVFTR